MRDRLQWLLQKMSFPKIVAIIFLIITSVLLPVFFNEVVQPIGSPRISSLSTEPLHIQGLVTLDEKERLVADYYRVSKTAYQIQPPMLRKNSRLCRFVMSKVLSLIGSKCDDYLRIELPDDVEIFAPGSGFWEKNPYVTVPERESPFNQNFINSRNFGNISVEVGTTAASVKTFPFKLYYREKIEMSCQDPGHTKSYWWDKDGSSLEEVPRVYCSTRPLARGWLGPPDRIVMYDFYELVLSNRGDLDIWGFTPFIRTAYYTEVCEDNKNVNLIGSGDKRNHILIDLKAGETRRMVIMNQYSEEDSREESRYQVWQPKEINFTHAGCNGDWKNQIF